jgi:hypothetical protein
VQYHEQYKAAAVSTANTQALIQPEEVRTSERCGMFGRPLAGESFESAAQGY